MRAFHAGLLTLAAVLLAACSGGDDPAPTPDFAAEAERLVPGAVLALRELEGFTAFEGEDIGQQADLSAECDVFDAAVVFPDAAATADSGPFEGRSDDQLLNYAAIYTTSADAQQAIAGTRELLERCEGEFRERIEQVVRDVVADFGVDPDFIADLDITIGEYEAPPAGEQYLGYRINVEVNLVLISQQYNLDVIFVREGRVAGALMYGRIGVINMETETMLVELAAGKLAETDEALPE